MKLTAKEKRLLDYLVECEEQGRTPTVGDICRACKTTVRTLLGKTFPSLEEKARKMLGEQKGGESDG